MNRSDIIQYTTTSLYGIIAGNYLQSGHRYIPEPDTTINDALDIGNPNSGDWSTGIIVLGRGGVYRDTDIMPYPIKHTADEASPREPIPLYLCNIETDHETDPRYCLRKVEILYGAEVAIYYGFRSIPPAPSISVTRNTDHQGTTQWVADPNLCRTRDVLIPPYLDIDSKEIMVTEYVTVGMPIAVPIVSTISDNIRSACSRLYDDVSMSLFSEIFICGGYVYNKDGREEISSTTAMIMVASDELESVDMTIDIGTSEPIVTHVTKGDIYGNIT